MKGPPNEPLLSKIERQIVVNPLTGCWEWTGAKDKDGYGVITVPRPKHTAKAHRVSWEVFSGLVIPKGLLVCHHCDNPPCINPKHLFLGTISDNNLDSIKKGRKAVRKGEQSPMTRLTNSDVIEMRRLRKQGALQSELAKRYGIAPNTVSYICRGISWNHI